MKCVQPLFYLEEYIWETLKSLNMTNLREL
jgi:hypothetical protein